MKKNQYTSKHTKLRSRPLDAPTRVILLNKPYLVLCQFSDDQGRATLADYIKEPGVYAAGRLDRDSEGLLLLTNSGPLQHCMANPSQKMPKTYWVQVEGEASDAALEQLRKGIELKDGRTQPAKVKRIPPPDVWERHPPVRFRAAIPTSWLAITLTEGKNRQVRRMTATVGLPTLRLIRAAIGPWQLAPLKPGDTLDISRDEKIETLLRQSPVRPAKHHKRPVR
ncbi:pseudouridine synthase [Celerinatantimonas yamalensis]|uniref:Pseudouridine synthase n=1 Tax=Celerinatantimonas yamalensis TaxID=559956 RepID=A0ABW9G3V8_9GAMM